MTYVESVVILDFWATRQHSRPIAFHQRRDPGLACRSLHHLTRRSFVPRPVAEKIAQPCRRCYASEAA